jgi:hypothetical protein
VWTYLTWHNFLLFKKYIFEEVFCAAHPALTSSRNSKNLYI